MSFDSEPPMKIQKSDLQSGFNTTSHKWRVRMALKFNGEYSFFTSRGRKFHNIICALYKNHFLTMGDIFDNEHFNDLSSWLTALINARSIVSL